MRTDKSVTKNELNEVYKVAKKYRKETSEHASLAHVAKALDDIGYDHIPSIRLRSGSQYINFCLNYARNLISDYTAAENGSDKILNLAINSLENIKKIAKDDVYLYPKTTDKSKRLGLKPLTFAQLKKCVDLK